MVSRNADEMAAHGRQLDLIVNTVAVPHDLDPYHRAAAPWTARMTLVGAPASRIPRPRVFSLIGGRRSLAGSLIGGIKETQEMLDFCAEHDIVSTSR